MVLDESRLGSVTDARVALDAEEIELDHDLSLARVVIRPDAEDGAVRLPGARIGGGLYGDFSSIQASDPSQRLWLDGLTYQGLPRAGLDRWLELIGWGTPAYAAQPYRQLAAASAANGHDAEVRRILIAQRRDQLTRATPNRWGKVWGCFTWWTLGYGYRPWLALYWLVVVTAISAALTLGFGTHVLHPKADSMSSCTKSERIVLGIDNALPLVTTDAAASCLPGPGPKSAAQWITWTGIGAQVAGWAFATLFVAGFTGAVRKT